MQNVSAPASRLVNAFITGIIVFSTMAAADPVEDAQKGIHQAQTVSPWEGIPESPWEALDSTFEDAPINPMDGPIPRYLRERVDVGLACKYSVTDLEGYDMVVVSRNGSADPDAPTDISVLTISFEDYHCLYPQGLATDVPVDPSPTNLTNDPDNATLSLFVPSLDAPEALVYTGELRIGGPGASTHAGPPESETISFEAPPIDIPALSTRTVMDMLPLSAPNVPGQIGGKLVLRTYLPMQGDSIYPRGGCNSYTTSKATTAMSNTFGGVAFDEICILDNSANKWNTCAGGCTGSVETLVLRLKNHILAKYPAYVNENNELITTYVWYGSNNGAALPNSRYSIIAEDSTNTPEAPKGTTMLHELGHNFGANHFPDDGIRKYYCNSDGTYYYSVMNYCYMRAGWMKFDVANGNIVYNNIW